MIALNNKTYYLDRLDGSYVIFNAYSLRIFIYRGNIDDYIPESDVETVVTDKPQIDAGALSGYLVSLTICVSESCNLACKYCYASGGSYGRDSSVLMTLTDMKHMFNSLLKIYPKGIINYTFFGGEPMLAFKEITQFVEYVLDESKNRNLKEPHFAIVTNGTLISEHDWDFFNKHSFAVTISLDGDKDVNDKMRVFSNSERSVFDAIKNNITSYGNRNFLMVAEATLGDFFFKEYVAGTAEQYVQTFKDLGFDSVSPFVAEYGDIDYNDSDFKEGIVSFYQDLVDYYMQIILSDDQYETVPTYILSAITNIIAKKSKRTCSAGKESLFYTATGDVYPCQMYYGNEENKIANVMDQDAIRSKIEDKKKIRRDTISECRECYANRFCNFWCPGGSYMFTGCEAGVDPIRCIVQKAIGERVIYWISRIFESESRNKFMDNIKQLSNRYSVQSFLGRQMDKL